MKPPRCLVLLSVLLLAPPIAAQQAHPASVPLPEHPRPDFKRPLWRTLNGAWDFRFEEDRGGVQAGWQENGPPSPSTITVPFSWGAPLSGITDAGDVGWYARDVEVPAEWEGRRVFLVVGASDWRTTAWLDGRELGTHQGGYTPFEFELTPSAQAGGTHRLVLRVDDTPHDFKLEGKQGYGPARGVWQTPYLEARGDEPMASLHFTPDVRGEDVLVEASLLEAAPTDLDLVLDFAEGALAEPSVTRTIPAGERTIRFQVPVPDPRLWSLDDPYLYEVRATVSGDGPADEVSTYFGMREISVMNLPGAEHRYVALNGEPVYLQLALDQAYHPEGFYTFPSDDFVRDEILRARRIGLNGTRTHVKVAIPRKLYWADRLGMLIMADVPNSWGEPNEEMRGEVLHALRGMIARDYNHPSIFAWVPFNETWGLRTEVDGEDAYLPETQEWVAAVYDTAKALDPSRLVEDNSVCCNVGHVKTDLNSWHAYLPGWAWEEELDEISANTRPGSTWNFQEGRTQSGQPNINSEFGNVWGYRGSTGDVDWSWDYHRALNAFRRHPAIAGWLYTEHHDVINEWNGYWRYDRSEKFTGMGDLAEGMSLKDLHAPFYIATGGDLSRSVPPGAEVEVPLWASFLTGTDAHGEVFTLRTHLYGWDALGRRVSWSGATQEIPWRPWMSESLGPLSVTMPDEPAVAILELHLLDAGGQILHRNFTTFVVGEDTPLPDRSADGRTRFLRVEPDAFSDTEWSLKQWEVLEGLKVNGAGSGWFEYRLPWPADVTSDDIDLAELRLEASAKQLFGKDRDDGEEVGGDFMRGGGSYDPSLNPNAYPMTDEVRFPSAVTFRINGVNAGRRELADDAADHRGILAWHAQLRDRVLREAGSYGELLTVAIPRAALDRAQASGELVVRLEVEESLPGGLAVYGRHFGRYPLDPTVVLRLR
jgi:hypothetical protein